MSNKLQWTPKCLPTYSAEGVSPHNHSKTMTFLATEDTASRAVITQQELNRATDEKLEFLLEHVSELYKKIRELEKR